MFSATEPLASTPLAANGTNKLVNGSAALSQAAQLLDGSSERIRVITGTGAVSQAAQLLYGQAIYSYVHYGTGALAQEPQELLGYGYPFKRVTAEAELFQPEQLLSGSGTKLRVLRASAALLSAAQTLIGRGTKIRVLSAAGNLVSAAQTLYGSEVSPIWIRTPRAPIGYYDVSRKITSEPYTTTNKYLTIYQVPGYQEVQTDGTIIELDATAVLMAFSATTANGTPQPVSLIIIKLLERGFDIFPLLPAYVVTTGVENIIPLRDFNLVTGDIIQIKALGAGDVTVNMSFLLNTQTPYEVL